MRVQLQALSNFNIAAPKYVIDLTTTLNVPSGRQCIDPQNHSRAVKVHTRCLLRMRGEVHMSRKNMNDDAIANKALCDRRNLQTNSREAGRRQLQVSRGLNVPES